MLVELETEQNETPSNAFIAAVVTLILYFVALFSVYHRNEQYELQHLSSNLEKHVNNQEPQKKEPSTNKKLKYRVESTNTGISFKNQKYK